MAKLVTALLRSMGPQWRAQQDLGALVMSTEEKQVLE